jgi:hypothetical protein
MKIYILNLINIIYASIEHFQIISCKHFFTNCLLTNIINKTHSDSFNLTNFYLKLLIMIKINRYTSIIMFEFGIVETNKYCHLTPVSVNTKLKNQKKSINNIFTWSEATVFLKINLL